jgi:hypothetical protein
MREGLEEEKNDLWLSVMKEMASMTKDKELDPKLRIKAAKTFDFVLVSYTFNQLQGNSS